MALFLFIKARNTEVGSNPALKTKYPFELTSYPVKQIKRQKSPPRRVIRRTP